jgi:hypothetical protein
MNINDPQFDRTLTLRQAYKLLEAFVVQYNARGESTTISVLADIGLGPDGNTGDPAQLHDFLRTANAVLGKS